MKRRITTTLGVALWAFASSFGATAAETSYVFDKVTRIDLHQSSPSITGVLRNSSESIKVTFKDMTNADNRHAMNRCVPVLLTMMEKPGRYFLNLTVDPDAFSVGMISCGLELRD